MFGLDLPLMEILFVFFVFNLAALIFIWYEIRRMGALLGMEKTGISHLDSDIVLLENFIHENPSETLTNYVSDRLEKGTPKKEIKKLLVNAGFKDDTINKIFRSV